MRLLMLFISLLSLAGCIGGGRESGLPIGATLVAEGFAPLSFQAPSDGRFYVWDLESHRLAYEASIKRGQGVWLDVITGEIGISMKHTAGRFAAYSRHQIFFIASTAATRPG